MTLQQIHENVFPVYIELEEIAIEHGFGMDMEDDTGRSIWLMVSTEDEETSLETIKTFLKTVESIRCIDGWSVTKYQTTSSELTVTFTFIGE